MRIVIAIDSFKGSLDTFEAGRGAAEGVLRVYPEAEVRVCPLADGGEGTVDAVTSALGGERVSVAVTGPLGEVVVAEYGMIADRGTAVMEMSAAAGITLVEEHRRDPLVTTTYGVGEMIAHAIRGGCRRFIMGIGGSATNDGGVGMLSALGFEFLDKEGKPIATGGRGLESLATIRTDGAIAELGECDFLVACDVKNPLCGNDGCSAVYGPQKGADPQTVKRMDRWLENYARLTSEILPEADKDFPGAGAAGGMGFALMSYLGGRLMSGIRLVMDETGLEEKIASADMVITGEGRLDGQSCMGKAPVGVASVAKKYGLPVIALSGCVREDAVLCNQHGIDAFFPILKAPCSLEEAMDKENAFRNIADTAEQAMRLVRTFRK